MRLFFLFLLAALPAFADSRSWRSASGNRSFRAEYVSSDGVRVTLKREDRKVITVLLENLHAEDRAWVGAEVQRRKAEAAAASPEGRFFDTLKFGDNRKTVEEKLKKSKLVSATLDERLQGRTGLNGIYETRMAGIPCLLYFDWTREDALREVTLRSKPVPGTEYDSNLRKNWTDLAALLGKSHGKPVQTTSYPARDELKDGHLLGSHLWHTKEQHSVLLCSGREGEGYVVAVRFSSELIPPRELPEPAPETPSSGTPKDKSP